MITLQINDFTSIEFQFGKTFRPSAKPNHVIIPTNRPSIRYNIYIFVCMGPLMRKMRATLEVIILTPNVIDSIGTSSPFLCTLQNLQPTRWSIKNVCNDLNKFFRQFL